MKAPKILLPVLATILLIGTSCQEFSLDTGDLEIQLDLNVIKTRLTVQFKNSTTGALIEPEGVDKISVTVFGPDSQWVVNSSGERKSIYPSATGYLLMGLDPYQAKPTAEDPVVFTLVAETPGYLSSSLPVCLTAEGAYDFVVNLVETSNPPNGANIYEKNNIGRANGGVLVSDIFVRTGNGEVELTIPAGTVLMDRHRAALDGQLDIRISYFDPTQPGTLASFPGGLSVEVINQSGTSDRGIFNPAGFINIEITDEKRTEAFILEKGEAGLKCAINSGVLNPETGQPLANGDKIPVWGYEEESGSWNFEESPEILSEPERLRLSTSLPRLSWWSFNWFRSSCFVAEMFFTTADKDKSGKTGWNYGFYFVATEEGSNNYLADGYFNGFPELTGTKSLLNSEKLNSVPQNSRIRITFSPEPNSIPLWNIPDPVVYDFCSGTPLEIPLSVNQNTTGDGDIRTVTITFNVVIYCTDMGAGAAMPDNTLLRYRVKGASGWSLATASGGQITIGGFRPDTPYEVEVLYQDEWKTTPIFEHHVEESAGNTVTANLRFEIACGG